MSGEGGAERQYTCPDDGALLLISDLPSGIVRGVYCRECRKRHTIFLGGRQTREQLAQSAVARNADGTPRPAAAPPPIETTTIRARRG